MTKTKTVNYVHYSNALKNIYKYNTVKNTRTLYSQSSIISGTYANKLNKNFKSRKKPTNTWQYLPKLYVQNVLTFIGVPFVKS